MDVAEFWFVRKKAGFGWYPNGLAGWSAVAIVIIVDVIGSYVVYSRFQANVALMIVWNIVCVISVFALIAFKGQPLR